MADELEPTAGEGWLVDRPEKQLALGVEDGHAAWVSYLHPGLIRFARESDAARFITALYDLAKQFRPETTAFEDARPVSHRWG